MSNSQPLEVVGTQPMETRQPPPAGGCPPSGGDNRSAGQSPSRSSACVDSRRSSGRPEARGSKAPKDDRDRTRQSKAREKQQQLTRLAMRTPLPAAPREVTPDRSGLRTWTDASGHNKFVASPRTGRVTHSTAQTLSSGQYKKFVATRIGYPGELGRVIEPSGEGADSAFGSPYDQPDRPPHGRWGTGRAPSSSPGRTPKRDV